MESNSLGKTVMVWTGIGIIATALSTSTAGQWIEHAVVEEWVYQFRGARPTPTDVAIVSMDKSAADLPAVTRSDRLWSRHLYAALIRQLGAAGASAIVMDVTFEDAGDEAADTALTESLAQANRVVIYQRLRRTDEGDVTVEPLSRFAVAARAKAVFPLPKKPQVQGYWPFFPVRDIENGPGEYKDLPSLPVAALQLRLLQKIGTDPFRRLLGIEANAARETVATSSPSDIDLPLLIDELRKKLKSDDISRDVVGRLIADRVDDRIDDRVDDRLPLSTMMHSLVQTYGWNGMLPLNFYGPPRTIQTIDHMLVLSEESIDSGSLHRAVSGKVVFIGHSAKNAVDQLDGIPTVYTRDGLDLSGVEIAATAYANLTDGSMLRSVPVAVELIIHVLLALIVACLALVAGVFTVVGLTIGLAIGYVAFAVLLFDHVHVLLPIGVPILLLLPFTLFTTLSFRYFGTDRQAGYYRHGIQQLLPTKVMADIESGGFKQADCEYLHGTCMISDIANYTHYSEEQGYERIANLSREYFSLLMEEIQGSGGELFDVEGDGMTAFWGHPEINAEAGHHAATAALQIMHKVEQFNERHSDTPFHTRIGLNSGWVEAAYIGGKGNYRYCLVGDVANTSSRLEGLNKRLGTSVLASSTVVSGMKSLLLRPVGVFLLKGKSRALNVMEIRGFRASATVEELALCERFGQALELIAAEQWVAAEKVLIDILLDDGTDGPARFYLELLNGNSSPEVHLEAQGIVRVDGK